MKLISRENLYNLLTIAAGGALLLGISQQFNKSAPPKAPDISDFVEVETLTNSNGQSVVVAILHREDFEAWHEFYPAAQQIGAFTDVSDMTRQLSPALEENGLSPEQAEGMAMNMAGIYQSATYIPVDLSDTPFVGLGPQALPERNEDFSIYACGISGVSRRHDGADWVRGFLEYPNAKINLPHNYAAEFSAFILNHERAHCMGANEAQADAAAARLLLKHHPDKNRARGALEVLRDLRVYREIVEAQTATGRAYANNALAIEQVLDDHARTGRIAMTDGEIWTLADNEAFEGDTQRLNAMQLLHVAVGDSLRGKNLAGAATQLRMLAQGSDTQRKRDLFEKIAQSLDRLDAITIIPGQQRKSKPAAKPAV